MSLDSWAEAEHEPATPSAPRVEPAAPASTAADGPPPSPAVHTVELAKRYRRTVALRSLSMTVARGEVFGFLGPNGAGKTTTVKLLLGLARPSGGEALVLGAPAGDVETRRRIGYLPELFRFQHWLTAREVLQLHARLLELARRDRRADEALALVGLADRADDKVATFSKGMQQRLGLAVALVGEPELVVLDEPTSALDPVGRHEVRAIVRRLRERGTTVFLNTHLLEEAEQVCDRVTVIDHGRAIATGTLDELLGARASVRLRVTGLPDGWWRAYGALGTWTAEGDWLRMAGAAAGAVPELVAQIVRTGGSVEAVVPEHQTLEDRFLELLGAR
ncbi:MAG TPA: ABC transporter ATP-binding protein [Acidimicrobiales bacterium]|nr:ABC transporter ATP-binding protein [Acidimicrobiales bacterium]